MINLNSRRAFWLAGLALISYRGQSQTTFNPINDSTVARYRYEVETHYYAELDAGQSFNEIEFIEKDYLKPLYQHQICSEGVNDEGEFFFQIQNLIRNESEDWIESPDIEFFGSKATFGLSASGEVLYQDDHKAIELQDYLRRKQDIVSHDYSPVLTFFPEYRDDFVDDAISSGAVLQLLDDQAFRLTSGDDEVTFFPKEYRIESIHTIDSVEYTSRIQYKLLAPYGYVPAYEFNSWQRKDLPKSIIRNRISTYRNHVIEDEDEKIIKYTDQAHVEVYPNPVQNEYEVLLKGIPNAIVSQAQVRDHLGNIVQTHLNPSVDGTVISLNASAYPIGPLILLVVTNQGVYTQTITKI